MAGPRATGLSFFQHKLPLVVMVVVGILIYWEIIGEELGCPFRGDLSSYLYDCSVHRLSSNRKQFGVVTRRGEGSGQHDPGIRDRLQGRAGRLESWWKQRGQDEVSQAWGYTVHVCQWQEQNHLEYPELKVPQCKTASTPRSTVLCLQHHTTYYRLVREPGTGPGYLKTQAQRQKERDPDTGHP